MNQRLARILLCMGKADSQEREKNKGLSLFSLFLVVGKVYDDVLIDHAVNYSNRKEERSSVVTENLKFVQTQPLY